MRRSSLLCALLCFVSVGCAPSLRMVHEGNVYFEHCYGADFDPELDDLGREACWNAWLAHYTRHQPAHRVDYAMRRVEALQSGDAALGLPGLNPGAPPQAALSETDVVTLEGPQAGAEAATRLETPKGVSVEHGCEATCVRYEQACRSRCKATALGCDDGCEREKAICRGGCY